MRSRIKNIYYKVIISTVVIRSKTLGTVKSAQGVSTVIVMVFSIMQPASSLVTIVYVVVTLGVAKVTEQVSQLKEEFGDQK